MLRLGLVWGEADLAGCGEESRDPGRSTSSGLRRSWGSQDGRSGLGEQRCARSWARLPIRQLPHLGLSLILRLVPVGAESRVHE